MTGEASWLPAVFIILMGIAMLVYAILDGYDLGVGILLPFVHDPEQAEQHRDRMIASIGPFWDANETWLVLGVGILLVAFPVAHSFVLGELYVPVALMLVGLILRGVAFDFRAKAGVKYKERWDLAFRTGSILATLSQGYMLGLYIHGFTNTWQAQAFAILSAVCVTAAYSFIGAAWLIMKTEGALQAKAVYWARSALWLTALGIMAVSVVNPLVSPRIFDKWFSMPNIILLAPIPLITFGLVVVVDQYLRRYPYANDFGCWIPFAAAVVIFILCFNGLAYSFYPYIVPGKMTIWQAASAPESLLFIFVGVVIVLPAIIAYTVYAYRVFYGKAGEISYE